MKSGHFDLLRTPASIDQASTIPQLKISQLSALFSIMYSSGLCVQDFTSKPLHMLLILNEHRGGVGVLQPRSRERRVAKSEERETGPLVASR